VAWVIIKYKLWVWLLLAGALLWIAITVPVKQRLNDEVTVWPIQRITNGQVDVFRSLDEEMYRVLPERQEVISMSHFGFMVRHIGCTVVDRLNWECPHRPGDYTGGSLRMIGGILADSTSGDDPDASFALMAAQYGYRVCPGETRYVSLWRWLRFRFNPAVRHSTADQTECAGSMSLRAIDGFDTQY
jgi:hypothetical protein